MPEEEDQGRTLSPKYGTARNIRYTRSPYSRFVEESASHPESDSIWLISLSDLLILLLVFFVFFLTARTTASHKNTEEQSREVVAPMSQSKPQVPSNNNDTKLRDELATMIRELNGADGITVQAARGEIIITLKERITFRPGEAEVLASSEPALNTISLIIHRNPSFSVEIDGHTDNIPISTRLYPSNWELSVARATAVLKYFINRCSIDPSRFIVRGNADLRPLVPNDTPEQRSENRRVEIRLKEIVTPLNAESF